MEHKTVITAELIRQLLDYDPQTGIFIWRQRPVSMFKECFHSASHMADSWNTKHVGKIAGILNDQGYIRITLFGRQLRAHRIAWLHTFGRWPSDQLDHINGCRSDNRIANLREANRSENNQNQKASAGKSSAYLGVHWDSSRTRWAAKIKLHGRVYNLGRFDSETEAYSAYLEAKARLHTFNPTVRE